MQAKNKLKSTSEPTLDVRSPTQGLTTSGTVRVATLAAVVALVAMIGGGVALLAGSDDGSPEPSGARDVAPGSAMAGDRSPAYTGDWKDLYIEDLNRWAGSSYMTRHTSADRRACGGFRR